LDPSKLAVIPTSNRSNVLKALVAFAKFNGNYESFTKSIKSNGIHWINKNGFDSFLRIMNNNHTDVTEWHRKTQTVLSDNERLFLKFTLLSGIRKGESVRSFNRIIELYKQNRLNEYYDDKQQILKHYQYKDNLRRTKNLYISIVPKELIDQVKESKPISYHALRKHLNKNKLNIEIKPLRSMFATFLRNKAVMSEIIDLLQGRIESSSVFLQHYLKLDLSSLSDQILPILRDLLTSVS
jgi:intergrase/recombinase